VSFINSKAGTFRNSDGSLLESAGRVDALDELIAAATSIDASLVQAIKDAVESLSAAAQPSAKLYVSIAEKIAAQGSGYVSKELARIGKLVSGNITPESRTNFQLKQNVLKAFAK
jgi:protein disulfide-isomerase A6